MKVYQKLYLFIIAVLTIFSACGTGSDDGFDQFSLEGTNTSMSEIAGNWNATRASFSKNVAGPVMEVDIVEIGGSLSLEIQNDGRFSVTFQVPNQPSETNTGRFAFDEDLLIISFDDDPDEWEYFGITHQEPNLTISGGTVYEAFDFDGNGTREDANIDFELIRVN